MSRRASLCKCGVNLRVGNTGGGGGEYTFFSVKGALCAEVIRLRVSYNKNDESRSQNSLRYLSKANLLIAVH